VLRLTPFFLFSLGGRWADQCFLDCLVSASLSARARSLFFYFVCLSHLRLHSDSSSRLSFRKAFRERVWVFFFLTALRDVFPLSLVGWGTFSIFFRSAGRSFSARLSALVVGQDVFLLPQDSHFLPRIPPRPDLRGGLFFFFLFHGLLSRLLLLGKKLFRFAFRHLFTPLPGEILRLAPPPPFFP